MLMDMLSRTLVTPTDMPKWDFGHANGDAKSNFGHANGYLKSDFGHANGYV